MKALIFDLDGTLIDSVYPHALAWQETLHGIDMIVPAWEIHRYIGISGRLLVRALGRARGRSFEDGEIEQLETQHDALFREYAPLQVPLPGAAELLKFLREAGVSYGIATTGKRKEIQAALDALQVGNDCVVVDGSSTDKAKPEPDLFTACRRRLRVESSNCLVVGDAVWDVHAARRAGILAVGVLTGGVGEQELSNAGAMRVYRDAGEVLRRIDELGLEL